MSINESYEELAGGTPYYDLHIDRLRTMAYVDEIPGGTSNPRKVGMNGWLLDAAIAAAIDTDEWCLANHDAELAFAIEDNGANGDGMWLNIDVINGVVLDGRTLASVRMSPRQAAALASALMAAVKQRETDDD